MWTLHKLFSAWIITIFCYCVIQWYKICDFLLYKLCDLLFSHGCIQYRNSLQTFRNSRVLKIENFAFANVSILNAAHLSICFVSQGRCWCSLFPAKKKSYVYLFLFFSFPILHVLSVCNLSQFTVQCLAWKLRNTKTIWTQWNRSFLMEHLTGLLKWLLQVTAAPPWHKLRTVAAGRASIPWDFSFYMFSLMLWELSFSGLCWMHWGLRVIGGIYFGWQMS